MLPTQKKGQGYEMGTAQTGWSAPFSLVSVLFCRREIPSAHLKSVLPTPEES